MVNKLVISGREGGGVVTNFGMYSITTVYKLVVYGDRAVPGGFKRRVTLTVELFAWVLRN